MSIKPLSMHINIPTLSIPLVIPFINKNIKLSFLCSPFFILSHFFHSFSLTRLGSEMNQGYDSEFDYWKLLLSNSPYGSKLFPYGRNLIQWGSEYWSSFKSLKTRIQSEPGIIKDSALCFGSSHYGGDLNGASFWS